MTNKYEGTCYIGVVGPDKEYGTCRDSIQAIQRRNGDGGPVFIRATKGYEARQLHLNKFMDSQHVYMLLLDHDMIFEKDTLERLRSHGLPYVSGLYMRRRFNPIAPIWFYNNPKGLFPMEPYLDVPEPGKLVKIGASGWGCVLLHRAVIDGIQDVLKGENEIIEDDMDIWPYDLDRVMGAIEGLGELVNTQPPTRTLRPALAQHVGTLQAEIRPLRGVHDVIGSDIRFPFYAKAAGFQLWGDPDVQAHHILHYPLKPSDYEGQGDEVHGEMKKVQRRKILEGRRRLKRIVSELGAVT